MDSSGKVAIKDFEKALLDSNNMKSTEHNSIGELKKLDDDFISDTQIGLFSGKINKQIALVLFDCLSFYYTALKTKKIDDKIKAKDKASKERAKERKNKK